ncbi:MAG: DUF5107 domain-containing protein [Prolixibacteraceae bacterium]
MLKIKRFPILTYTRLSSILSLLVVFNSEVYAQGTVSLQEKSLVLPTYSIAPADKKPFFFTGRTYQGAKGEIYPYPMYDVLTDKRVDKEYKGVYLENQYINVCVVPELGGRILSATDKTDNYEFFYRQHVVKPALIGMIGAWMSGGVEWNIPDHHRASTMLPVDYKMEEHADGSKTVWVGETEWSRRIRWMVGLTVYPDRSYIEATVKVFNPTPFIHSFLYWANVSVHCDENYQVIFPPKTQFGAQHAKGEFTPWEIGDGMYSGVDRTGVDLSWWKNHPNPASIFAWNFNDDFLAGYDYAKEAGTVHVANHQIVGGKKFFLFGNNPDAEMWEKMLTEKDGQYLELMVGAYSNNQPDYSWISPGETKVFKQIWYPIRKIGEVKNANQDAAVSLERTTATSIKFGFNATTNYPDAQVKVFTGNRVAYSKTITINPATPFLAVLAIGASVKDKDIKVVLSDKAGKELISYQPEPMEKEQKPEPVEVPRAPETYKSNQELYLTGLRIDQFRNARTDPEAYYEEALKRDSLDYLVNNVMGIRSLKDGRYNDATNYLRKALKRLTKDYTSPKDVEAYYYKGILNKVTHQYKEAKDAFWKATWNKGFVSSSYYNLAEIACVDKDFSGALELINSCVAQNTMDAKAQSLKAYILRKLGKTAESTRLAKQTEEIDNLYFWNLAEQNFQDGLNWNNGEINGFKVKLQGNVQSLLELVLNYGNAGAYPEAIQLLNMFIAMNEPQSDFPLLYYYRGFFELKNGLTDVAQKSFAFGKNAPTNLCFPFRLEEIEILETAVAQNPGDSKAYYYLGNLYYYLNQKEKAIKVWEQSVETDHQFYLAQRNLGFAYNQVEKNPSKAIAAYEQAIQTNPNDPGLFAEIDVLYEKNGNEPKNRLKLLEDNLKTVDKRDDATMRLTLLYNELGYYLKALKILQIRHFHVWEGGGEIHDIFVNSCLLEGISQFNKKQFQKALEHFQQALSYPDNLEVGKPYDGGRIAEVSYFIGKTYEALGQKTEAMKSYQESANWKSKGRTSDLDFYKALSLGKLGQHEQKNNLLAEIEKFAQSSLQADNKDDFFSKFGSSGDNNSRKADSHYLLGLYYCGTGNYVQAQKEFDQTLSFDKNHLWAKSYFERKIRIE